MSKTLQEERDQWEDRPHKNPRKTLVTHFEMKHRGSHITILVEGISGANDQMTLYYDMIRYFKIGDDWVTSCDVKSGNAHDIMRKFAELV